ncbi:MAG: bifunctional phosphopantothenoylcysteine decarboxylase/phosphopantothenate--cysteine ligase CoaBC [Candidatus Cloacimonetes bacterium]|nr:bifunctional phosphopantothenoylcysteine decarboxylase/phosphopantothenate--cysteine ligase CoaBC [Candidatus Cloacimonadota bacterium]
MLDNKKILFCLCGGIAVYKCVELASQMVKEGAIIKTIMTKSAMEFVTPLTFQSITKNTVSYKLFNHEANIEHISLADWADIIVIVPATANIIGKIANGIADDLITTTVMASSCPKLIVPAMNVNMYENPILQENINKLKSFDFMFLEPEIGRLACGYEGKGRMPAIDEIIYALKVYLHHQADLKGKSFLVTAGASIEKIDPMRYITNISSGKMGFALARAAYLRGGQVTLIYSSVAEKLPYYVKSIQALSAKEMHDQVLRLFPDFDCVISCAAVADFTPQNPSPVKIKKSENLTIELVRTIDILKEMGEKKDKQYLIGFAAESENILKNAHQKLENKNLNMIVANDLKMAGKTDSEIFIIKKNQNEDSSIQYQGDKFFLANKILDEYINDETT